MQRANERTSGKKWGKPLMKKSKLPEKKKVVAEVVIDSEEEDIRDFLNG